MTNFISNSIVVVDVATNGSGTMAGMVKMEPIYIGFAIIVFAIVTTVALSVWLKKSK